MTSLVERDAALEVLERCLDTVRGGCGHTVLIAGEAGMGKTSVLKAFAQRRGEADLWWGNCDPLQTPHPLAPLHDIARSSDVPFRSLMGIDTSRVALFEAVLAELQQRRRSRLVIVEDVHWADEATLDLLRFIGRRIDRTACLLAISYRDDELTLTHPLRRVLGELPTSLVTRLDLRPLSSAAVELLARRALRSPAGIYTATRGNPFFVTELLRDGVGGVPRSVQDLVLGRFARLSPAAQAVVRLASVVPAKIERPLIDRLLGSSPLVIDECLNSGLLNAAASALCFRHELARVAIETSLSEPAARALHAEILAALVQAEGTSTPLARLVHHATRAGDADSVLRFAPRAALQALQRGAHREAAAHYRTALEWARGIDDRESATWREAYANECQVTDQLDDAIAARLRLDEFYRRAGDTMGEAENLSKIALAYVAALRNAEADAASRRAIELLETLPSSEQLAAAYRVEGHLRMLNREYAVSAELSGKAMRLAEHFAQRDILAAAMSTLGTATMFTDYEAGCAHLRCALEMALADRKFSIVANAYTNLGSGSGELFRLHEARRFLVTAISFAAEHELECDSKYSTAWLALCEMYLGRWDDAAGHAQDIIAQTASTGTNRIVALVALGRLQTRRGDSAAAETLDEALELAGATNTLQRLAPVRAARAEAAFLRADLPGVVAEAEPALRLAVRHQHPWFSGELAYWMQRAGALETTPAPCAEPFALQIGGRFRAAAAAWAALGCPYEQARALAEGAAEDQREALALFDQLGARPAADGLRRRLRASGVRGVPRGLRASTQANPHELTAREYEVLELLCNGLRNSEIAERLCRSVRTVDHHLEAAYAKLNVSSRTEAVAAALRLGIEPQNGQVQSAK